MKVFLTLSLSLIVGFGFAQSDFTQLDKVLLDNQKALGGKECMLVFKDGKIVYEKNIGGYTKTTIEPIASCSKWLTAALVMTFVDEKKLSLEDTIGKFLPVFTKNKKGHIKIWQCLSHTTGIQGENITLATIMQRSKFATLEEEVNDFAKRPMIARPGDQFFYGGIGINIAGRILEVISGKSFETIFQERIAKPLGMTQTTFVNDHTINPSGGVMSSASDFMKFLVMILNKGTVDGKKILKKESVELMEKSWTADVKIVTAPEEALNYEYGLGQWILETDEIDNSSVVSSPGLFGTFPYVEIDKGYAAILFVKTMQYKNRDQIYKAVKAAVDAGLEK